MIFNSAINVGPFAYCATYYGPHTTKTYFNDHNGHYHQWLYIVDGSARAEVREGESLSSALVYEDSAHSPGTLLDISPSKGKYVTTTTADTGMCMIMFNPIPDSRKLAVEMVKGPITQEVTAGSQRITLVCIQGPITVNDKTVEGLQHVKIFPGKTVTITLPDHAVCALVQDK